ncbi:MAG: hypothetical protein E6K53_07945 [Gammaproteobacteria bacterium]|nr:MAG: hypothetical protein E6K53_07945 [Gammaproteobacteria bacterium]
MSRWMFTLVVLTVVLLAGCSSGSNTGSSAKPAAQATGTAAAGAPTDPKAAAEAKALKDFQLYDQMRIKESYDLAVPLGADIVKNYPDTTAAAKVKETLDDGHGAD